MAKKYIKSKSVYTQKKKVQTLSDASILFENDYTTLTQNTLPISDPVVYSQGNFKIVTSNDSGQKKQYGTGDWLTSDECTTPINSGEIVYNTIYVVESNSGYITYPSQSTNHYKNGMTFTGIKGDTTYDISQDFSGGVYLDNPSCFWTIDDLASGASQEASIVNIEDAEDEKVVLKPDTTYLSSFAYFGSLFELIRSSFENIINTFPASLWVRPKRENNGTEVLYELVNDFDIDLVTDEPDNDTISIKTMISMFGQYEIVRTTYGGPTYSKGGNVEYKDNILTNCKYDVTLFKQVYRYVILDNGTAIISPTKPTDDSKYVKQLDTITFIGAGKEECGGKNIEVELTYQYYDDFGGDPCLLKSIFVSKVSVDGTEILLTGNQDPQFPSESYHIKPKESIVNDYFLGLNDFQKVILNTATNPKYTSIFKIPEETENGIFYRDYAFTWGTPDGWNLDIKSLPYIAFVDELTKVAVFLDDRSSDNIYGRMTHESIKNLDATYSLAVYDENETDEYIDGETRIQKLLRLYGRVLDEVKKYIDGVRTINTVTYDQKGNLPDAYLKDFLSLKGWSVTSPIINGIRDGVTDRLYYGRLGGYTSKEMEQEFYRRLLINSNHILRGKGTKNGLEMLMGLFGISRDSWSITEYVYQSKGVVYQNLSNGDIVKDLSSGVFSESQVEDLEKLNKSTNYSLLGLVYNSAFSDTTYATEEEVEDPLHDLCVAKQYLDETEECPTCDGTSFIIINSGTGGTQILCPTCGGSGVTRKYVGVPYFKGNSNRLYYQQNGGWYRETLKYLRMVDTLDDLVNINRSLLATGDIYYVDIIPENVTHYYVLADLDSFNTIYGWDNIDENYFSEYTFNVKGGEVNTSGIIPGEEYMAYSLSNGYITYNGTNYYNRQSFIGQVGEGSYTITGVATVYTVGSTMSVSVDAMNGIVDILDGNNPHVGYGNYDYGMNYLEYFGGNGDDSVEIYPLNENDKTYIKGEVGLFKYTMDNAIDCIKSDAYKQWTLIQNWGFIINEVLDTKKSWYVDKDGYLATNDSYTLYPNNWEYIYPEDRTAGESPESYTIGENTRPVGYNNTSKILSGQVINTKTIMLTYNYETDEEGDFFNSVILPYIEQMVPSTSIFRLKMNQITLP